jgi:hypothetical protein
MRIQVTMKLPNGAVRYQIYYGAQALINERGILEIYRGNSIIAQFPPESFVSWQYVAPPLQPTSRAQQLLLQHPEK